MHSRLSRLIALFAILICLPLQGLAAAVMPACQTHGQKMEMQLDACQPEIMAHCDHAGDRLPGNAPCDKCIACYLSAAQAIIPFKLAVESNGIAPMLVGLSAEIPDSVPSSPFRPPRSTFG